MPRSACFVACFAQPALPRRGVRHQAGLARTVFFRQTRLGKEGEPFSCCGFQTMQVGAEQKQDLLNTLSKRMGRCSDSPPDPA